MNRRTFLIGTIPFLCGSGRKSYRFRIKTKSGGIVTTTVEANDIESAKVKLYKRYPSCSILGLVEVK